MTPADHNKMIGIMHLIYGGFFTLMALLMLIIFGTLFTALSGEIAKDPNAPPAEFFMAIFGLITFIYFLLSIPGLIAGYAMLKKKSWARVAGIIASVVAAVSFPFGTALCVYSLWFFFGDSGRAYERSLRGGDWQGSLNQGAPLGWEAQAGADARQHAYKPPAQPPDWRNNS
jgi:hypothetical protein